MKSGSWSSYVAAGALGDGDGPEDDGPPPVKYPRRAPEGHTAGPWFWNGVGTIWNTRGDDRRTWDKEEIIVASAAMDYGDNTHVVKGEELDANCRLIAAAPAYAVAWSMVPDEIRQRIFDALFKPDTEWVEKAIDLVESHGEAR